jgi:hypothetical protein
VKKVNPDVEDQDDDTTQPPAAPPTIPPLRTFVLWRTNQADGSAESQIISAHGLAIDESRLLTFFVFFIMDGKPLQAPIRIVNSDIWTDVEEINLAFPTTVNH